MSKRRSHRRRHHRPATVVPIVQHRPVDVCAAPACPLPPAHVVAGVLLADGAAHTAVSVCCASHLDAVLVQLGVIVPPVVAPVEDFDQVVAVATDFWLSVENRHAS
jgi:hypothetical protein